MTFEPSTVDDLGLRLYSTLPPVVSELVSNAHDAESAQVEVELPVGPITAESEVVIRDFGHGLSSDEIQEQFLPIGRKRRGKSGSQNMSRNGKVKVTGRKGLGKLSAFGIAMEMEVRFVQGGQAICLRLNYDDLTRWPELHPGKPYEPTLVTERSGQTKDKDGAEVRLRRLRRTSPINADEIRRGLARRLSFIGSGFIVKVNGQEIGPGDRVRQADCDKNLSWDVTTIPPAKGVLSNGDSVTGWIGFLPESRQTVRGIDIFANRKAAELESYFRFSSTHAQWARAYLVGEINADFLDAGEDLIATARNSVTWESPKAQSLQEWGQEVLKWAFDKWLEGRRERKEKDLITIGGFDKWLATRTATERRIAARLVRILVDDANLDPESAVPLLEMVKSSVETKAFHELIDTIESKGSSVSTLLSLFEEWRIIEAREHLRLADGRQEVIEQLRRFMDEGALEVQQMQPLFEKNPWLIDGSWSEVDGQATYTQMLRDNCPEPKDYEDVDRRMDILGIRQGGGLFVVELKRPQKTLNRKDLEQIEKYVDWARNQFGGSGNKSVSHVSGLLVVGQLSHNGDVQLKQERLAGSDIRVETFQDIHNRASEYYRQVEKELAKIAPEYTKATRKSAKKP